MRIKVTRCNHVTATEKKHLRAFLESGLTQSRVNTKRYTILSGRPLKKGYEYNVRIETPYTSAMTGRKELTKQDIILEKHN